GNRQNLAREAAHHGEHRGNEGEADEDTVKQGDGHSGSTPLRLRQAPPIASRGNARLSLRHRVPLSRLSARPGPQALPAETLVRIRRRSGPRWSEASRPVRNPASPPPSGAAAHARQA